MAYFLKQPLKLAKAQPRDTNTYFGVDSLSVRLQLARQIPTKAIANIFLQVFGEFQRVGNGLRPPDTTQNTKRTTIRITRYFS
jgi:hypothetical protein